jgi:foldase protein PrsA
MKKKILLLSLIGVLFMTAGCAKIAKLENGQEVVATVDGYSVTADDLYSKMKAKSGSSTLVTLIDTFIANKEQPDSTEITTYAKDKMTSLEKQYTSYGYTWSQVLTNAGYKSSDELLQDLILDRKKTLAAQEYVKSELTESEIQTYYDENISSTITAKHILIEPSTGNTEADKWANALTTAKEVIAKLDSGELTWADAVTKYTADSATKDSEGKLADFTITDITTKYGADFWTAVNNLEAGKYTETPVKSTYGYHIVLKVSATDRPSLEDKLSDIKDALVTKKFDADTDLVAKTWVKIREKYNLSIADTDLNEGYEEGIASYKTN